MNRNTTAVLASIAIALFAYITLFERDSLTTGELEGRQERLFETFVRNRVERVELERDGETIVIAKQVNEDGTIGEWQMLQPFEGLADEDSVGSLLGALEWSDARRTFQAVEGEAATFGFDAPRITLRLLMGNTTLTILVGNDEASGGGVYMSDDGGRTVKVAGLDVFEAVDHDVDHFRSKRLLERGVLTATSLSIGELELSLGDESWRLGNGLWAARAPVEEALEVITNVEAESYPEGVLGDVTLRAVAVRPTGADEGEGGEVRVVLEAGDACESAGEVRVRIQHNGENQPLACVLSSVLDPLRRPEGAWLERRPATTSDIDLRSVRIEQGESVLAVARGDDGSWSGTVPVDPEALALWVQEIRRLRARDIRPTAEFAAYGLEAPRVTLTLSGTGGEETLQLGQLAEEGLFVRRGAEQAIAVFDPALNDLLLNGARAFRPRQLLDLESLDWISIERDGVTERLEKQDGDWFVVSPIRVAAERSGARELVDDLRALRAVRFPSEEAPNEEAPVRVRFAAGDEEHVLSLGASLEDGVVATLDGTALIASPVLRRRFDSLLVAQDSLSVPTYEIDGLRIEQGARVVSIQQDDGQFVTSDGDAIDDERAGELTQALGRLRGRPLRFGELDEIAATVIVTLHEGGERTLRIGPQDGQGGLFAQDSGLPVIFVVPETSLRPLLDFQP